MSRAPARGPDPRAGDLERRLRSLLDALPSGEALGERMLILGSGPIPVSGAVAGGVALDETGGTVLIAAVPRPDKATAEDLADHLDRIAQLSPDRLSEEAAAEGRPADLIAEHRRAFGPSDTQHLNLTQRVLLLVSDPPSAEVWESLDAELGTRLGGVYVADGKGWRAVAAASDARLRERPSGRSLGLGLATLVAGLAIVVVGVVNLFPDRGAARAVVNPAPAEISTILEYVSGEATHTQWIGQRRLVQAPDGTLLALYASAERLHVVGDEGDGGRTWQAPVAVPEIVTRSFSAAVDDGGRLHVAYSDGRRISYASLTPTRSGWEASPVVRLESAGTDVVDVAWEARTGTAQVVWASGTAQGQLPRWAMIRPDPRPRVVDSAQLAPPGGDRDVLANVGTGPGGLVVATYRSGNASTAWASRSGRAGTRGVRWSPERTVPAATGAGAGSLAVDRRGIAHLVLREDRPYRLRYFRLPPGGRWSSGETVVRGRRLDDVELPSITVDANSAAVYVFFQTEQFWAEREVRVAVRRSRGWSESYGLVPPGALEGVNLPTAIEQTTATPVVLWTTRGEIPALQAVRFVAP